MIRLDRNKTNKIVMTLSEKEGNIYKGPFYKLRLKHSQTGNETTLDIKDLSSNTERYNEFHLMVDPKNPVFLDNDITYLYGYDSGYYEYTALTNDEKTILEIGKLYIVPENKDIPAFKTDKEIYTYKG